MYKYLLFDLDGTLTDSSEGITKCVRAALEGIGIHEPDDKKLFLFIGPPLRESFKKYYNLNPEQVDTCMSLYRKRYNSVGKFENRTYPGIVELLRDLKAAGYICAMCTAKPEFFAVPIAEKYGLAPYLTAIFGAAMDGSKDDKAMVVAASLKGLGLNTPEEKAQAVLIGDREQDVKAAHANNIKCIGIGWGFANPGELEAVQVDEQIATVEELRRRFLE